MEKNRENLDKNLEEKSIKAFEDFLAIKYWIEYEQAEFFHKTQEEENDMLSVEEAKKNIEQIRLKYKDSLDQLGLDITFDSEFDSFNDENNFHIESRISLEDITKFANLLKNLPPSFVNEKNRTNFGYNLLNLFHEEASNFYEKEELSDNLIKLKDFSDDIWKKLKKIFNRELDPTEEELLIFFHNFKDAYKDGYLKELSAVFCNNLLSYHFNQYDPVEFYKYQFFIKNEETNDEDDINVILFSVEERLAKLEKVINDINPKISRKDFILYALKNLSDELELYASSALFIKNSEVKDKYEDIVYLYKNRIEEKKEKILKRQ